MIKFLVFFGSLFFNFASASELKEYVGHWAGPMTIQTRHLNSVKCGLLEVTIAQEGKNQIVIGPNRYCGTQVEELPIKWQVNESDLVRGEIQIKLSWTKITIRFANGQLEYVEDRDNSIDRDWIIYRGTLAPASSKPTVPEVIASPSEVLRCIDTKSRLLVVEKMKESTRPRLSYSATLYSSTGKVLHAASDLYEIASLPPGDGGGFCRWFKGSTDIRIALRCIGAVELPKNPYTNELHPIGLTGIKGESPPAGMFCMEPSYPCQPKGYDPSVPPLVMLLCHSLEIIK